MSTPLSPSSAPFSFNARTPSSARHRAVSNLSQISPKSPLVTMEDSAVDSPSSPFISLVDQENLPPRADSQMDKTGDLKIFDDEKTTQSVRKVSADVLSPIKTSRINSRSPSKRFSVAEPQFDTVRSPQAATPIEAEPTLRDNEGLTMAIDAMETEKANATFSDISYYHNPTESIDDQSDADDIDNTCFSTFSEIPNADMTAFAQLGHKSPTKQLFANVKTPRKTPGTPGTARKREYHGYDRSPSPTPRRHKSPTVQERDGDTTNLLLDFTEQFHAFSGSSRRSPTKRHSPSKSTGGEASLRNFLNNQRSPAKNAAEPSTPRRQSNLMNLLDFELPPMPTPRSIPTITVREMESMKSNYQSQISSLTATLSGRAAEVESLKKAVADAERRVGEAQEQVREETAAREHAEREKSEWERRGVEVEDVLRSIREEVFKSDKEREELLRKLEESDRRAEEAEARAAETETRALEAESKVVDQSIMTTADSGDNSPRYTAEEVQRQIDEKVATLCRELHVVYKKKHETKVAALKKSYESKAEKKHVELTHKVEELSKQIEHLQSRRNDTLSGSLPEGFDPRAAANREADQKRLEEQKSELEEQKTRLAGLAGEIEAARAERTQLLQELENERREKGELVAAVDEMLSLQATEAATPRQQAVVEDFRRSVSGASSTPRGRPDNSGPSDFRSSGIGKPSGLRGPGFGFGGGAAGESRIGRGVGASGVNRSGGVPKSRMMSNIERMGMSGRGQE
ncbi:microtubule protein alp7 [Diplodia corticola]|uniref:Microtubule protein alp7 n=1 Tax=Diplodia corticola TaxID=236234 RepID=A0A1J9RIU2_9PEZI|nr:microtubule protein alp7 [Diplodia corticola]OJD39946.1 microtubule protein alp7 [Diplodia corticola]